MSITDKLTIIAENESKVYEAGKKAEHDKFWDVFQENGKRTNYPNTYGSFSGYLFTFDNFYPKYDIRPEGNANQLFYAWTLQRGNVIGSLTQRLKDCGVVLDTSKATSLTNMFAYTCFTELPTISFVSDTSSSANNIRGIFTNNPYLETIEKIIVTENTYYQNWFTNDTNLKNVTFEGVIGQNGLDFSPCTKLSAESCHNILTCLKDFRTVICDKLSITSALVTIAEGTLNVGETYTLTFESDESGIEVFTGTVSDSVYVFSIGENKTGMEFSLQNLGNNEVALAWIYQDGNEIKFDIYCDRTNKKISLVKDANKIRTITMPEAVKDNGNATPEDIAEAEAKGWEFTWVE